MSEYLLQVENLAAGYGDVQVLWDVGLQVKAGEIVCLVGSNGAGKTTTLRCLSGLVPASSGRVVFEGEALAARSPVQLVERGIAHVPEGRRLFSGLSVYDNLLLGAYRRRDGHEAIARDIERVYALFPRLAERRRQDATTLSGGEQQMCAVARGLMAAPKLLMIDELSLGLAPKVVGELIEALRIVNREGTSLLIVEQDVATALDLADRGYVMDQGRTVAQGAAEDLRNDPAIRAAYLGV
ncbi:MAG: ABC transporter ATP-binding protein [Burkholderiaceae bacterium]